MKPKVKKLIEALLSENPDTGGFPNVPNEGSADSALRTLASELKGLGWKVGEKTDKRTICLEKPGKNDEDVTHQLELYAHNGEVCCVIAGNKKFSGEHVPGGQPWEDSVDHPGSEMSQPFNSDLHKFADHIDDEACSAAFPQEYPYSDPPGGPDYDDNTNGPGN